MANLNKTECLCEGFWENGMCVPALPTNDPNYVNPCPSIWTAISTWNWGEISNAGLEWGYGLGLLNRPDYTDTAMYMYELERQRRQTMYILMGLLTLAIVVAIVLVRRKK